MKTKILLVIAVLLLTGCQTAGTFVTQIDEFNRLGITEMDITGKFSNTSYRKTVVEDQTVTVLEHNNAWLPKVRIVRKY